VLVRAPLDFVPYSLWTDGGRPLCGMLPSSGGCLGVLA